MIYFDSGATSLQKPPEVYKAVQNAMTFCASPGRGGHRPSFNAAKVVHQCREALCALFSVDGAEKIVFTLNATHALNLAIKSALRGGGHAVITGYEHNSVVRPLEAMRGSGVSYTAAHSPLFDTDAAFDAIKNALRPDTRCVILNHVSNVFGFVLPLARVDELCAQKGLPLIVDASQSAGVLEIDASKLKSAVFICMPGHKGLYGPQGTGVLISCKDNDLYSLIEGGTGSNSIDPAQPDFLPDIFESGTHNVPGIAGLLAGVKFITQRGTDAIMSHERRLASMLAEGLNSISGVTARHSPAGQTGVLAFTVRGRGPEALAEALAARDICVRAGLHCAPLAHKSAGTLPAGAVRVSFSAFNADGEVNAFLREISDILKKF